MGTVRPYLHGELDLAELFKHAFDAQELERFEYGPDAYHLELQVGDSVVVLEVSNPPHSEATKASTYIYVADVDAVFNRAVQLGATVVAVPEDKPYSERACGISDQFGNIFWISTYR